MFLGCTWMLVSPLLATFRIAGATGVAASYDWSKIFAMLFFLAAGDFMILDPGGFYRSSLRKNPLAQKRNLPASALAVYRVMGVVMIFLICYVLFHPR
jgi:ABC-type polysaccharide/polyol phosphate export permease